MSQDVYTIVKQMNLQTIETQLALQCAPLIVGLKVSNLFIIRKEDVSRFRKMMQQSDIVCYCLLSEKDRMTFLLFRKNKLIQYLADEEVGRFLKKLGYQSLSLENILEEFRKRYWKYLQCGEDFPHEMGILLGYPLEDVIGFMEHNGKNFLHSGYWKVYDNLQEKLSLFQKYDSAMEALIQFLHYGINMMDILDIYRQQKES